MGEVLKIFISATSADLGAVREAARDFFNNRSDRYKAREQEQGESVPATLLVNDRRHLADCHAVLHIVGECYGAEPADGAEPSGGGEGAEPGGQRAVVAGVGGKRRSYTQREYDHARALKKPLYLFVCEESFPYKKHKRETKENQALQRAHRAAILAGDDKYERIADFADLEKQLGRIQLALQRLEDQLRRTRRRDILLGGAVKKVGKEVRRLGKTTAAGTRTTHRKLDELKDQLGPLASPLQRYYQNLREQFANYDNVGLPVTAREGKEEMEEPIKIRDLFVPPHCSTQHIKPAELDAAVREGKTLGEPLLPLLEKPGARLVLLADPGMGKSTVIQLLIATLADDAAPADAPGLRGANPFPFVLRELVRLLPADVKKWNWEALLDAFCRWDPRSGGEGPLAAPIADRATFRTLIGREDAFFLIDGLDEIGDPVKREVIRDAILEGFGACRDARWLITSRIVGYEWAEVHETEAYAYANDIEVFRREAREIGAINASLRSQPSPVDAGFLIWADLHYLAPFNDAQQRAFAEHWYMPRMGETKGVGRAREFIAAVHQHPHTRVIGRIPNLLYLLALLYRHQAQLPHGRALVYEAISEAYLESIPLQRRLLGEAGAFAQSFPEKEQLLAIVGMKMQQMRASRKKGEDGDILVSREQLAEWLGPRFASVAELEDFLHHVARHSGLLLPRGEGLYGFAHLSFQEYYAARHLQGDFARIMTARARPAGGFLRRTAPETVENEERLFAECAALTVWHEPLLFLAEKFRASPAYTTQLLEWMFPQLADDPAKGADWMPITSAKLLATLSIDPELALDATQRHAMWQALWKAHFAAWGVNWQIASSLVVAGSSFQSAVLHAVSSLQPERLSLSRCPALDDITPLARLTGLWQLDLNFCTGLDDFTPLAGLTVLRYLHLTGCTALRDLPPLAELTGLQILSLSGCTALVDIAALGGLIALRYLHLDDCTALGDLRPLAGLSGLELLNLSGCPALGDLTPLAGLTGLHRLDLRGCTGVGDLTPLAGLTGLRHLFLEGCTGLSDLTPLVGLFGLKRLDLHGCKGLDKEEIESLQKALPKTQIRS